jgi:isocitrate dehydrogenase
MQYKATELMVPGPGRVEITFVPKNGGPGETKVINEFDGAGVTLAMFNTDESIR